MERIEFHFNFGFDVRGANRKIAQPTHVEWTGLKSDKPDAIKIQS